MKGKGARGYKVAATTTEFRARSVWPGGSQKFGYALFFMSEVGDEVVGQERGLERVPANHHHRGHRCGGVVCRHRPCSQTFNAFFFDQKG